MRGFLLCGLLLAPAAVRASGPERSVVLVGWDGADRRRLRPLLDSGKLPNLAVLISSGSLVDTRVTTGSTETKPGWSEILTGRSADEMGIEDNKVYGPIPEGATVFERAKKKWGKGVCTIFVSGKVNNIGIRGPHMICVNCATRDVRTRQKTDWWDQSSSSRRITRPGLAPRWVKRAGEPFFHAAASVDHLRHGLKDNDEVVRSALEGIRACGARPFFAFVHFERPDEDGHTYGEDSPQYLEGFEEDDRGLGKLLEALSADGRRSSAAVVVTTDHGMNAEEFDHQNAPDTWLASDRPGLRPGDRKDAGATLLELLGLDVDGLAGRPLTRP